MKLTFQLTITSCFVDDDQSSTEVDFIVMFWTLDIGFVRLFGFVKF